MNALRVIARGFGIKLAEPNYEHIEDLEEGNEELDEYIESDGNLGRPEPTSAPPKPTDAAQSVTPPPRVVVPTMVQFDEPSRAPKKKPEQNVPVLDEGYFQKKRRLEAERADARRISGFSSASTYPFYGASSRMGSASYYGYATAPILLEEARMCAAIGRHDYRGGRCWRCMTPEPR